MKILAALILGLALGWTTTALASPIQQTTNQDRIAALEARLQALEYLRWTENHAIDAVSYKVWERVSSCAIPESYECYNTDPVLMPFDKLRFNGVYDHAYSRWIAKNAYPNGLWYAQDNGDGDSWNVWVVVKTQDYGEYHITWTVWQSNGYIQAAQ
jgi:hypothetical protein